MESTAAWAGPYELQQAKNWTVEVSPADDAQVWAPAVGHPLQYASIADIFGSSCSLQPYVVPASSSYSSGGQQQLVESYNYYNDYYAAAAQHHDPDPMDKYAAAAQHPDPDPVETYMKSPERLFLEKKFEFKDDAGLMKRKMHRYPPSIQALGDWCTVPKVVAIGPYYHGQDHLQKAEEMKYVAAQYCFEEYERVNKNNSGLPPQDMYEAVVSVVKNIHALNLYDKDVMEGMGYVDDDTEIDARSLYDKDVMAGIGYEDDFLPMMFFDACFLVIYMLRKEGTPLDEHMFDFFESNDTDIARDITLLENQIPFQVVYAVLKMCTEEPLERINKFIAMWLDGFLQDQVRRDLLPVGWNQDNYDYSKAPHLLGLLRSYAVGKGRRSKVVQRSDIEKMETLSISAGANELAQMGISLTANKTTELPDMGLDTTWIIFKELSVAPLSLSDARASWLVNMAALELCTTPDFFDHKKAEFEDSAVCSYLLLLCMLMHREEDVHELRSRGILRGAGRTNSKTLEFFSSLHSLRHGPCYALVMTEIENFKNKRSWMVKAYVSASNNWKYITAFVGAVIGFIGLVSTLMGLFKGGH